MHWGLSESLDLYEEYVKALKALPPIEEALSDDALKEKEGSENEIPTEDIKEKQQCQEIECVDKTSTGIIEGSGDCADNTSSCLEIKRCVGGADDATNELLAKEISNEKLDEETLEAFQKIGEKFKSLQSLFEQDQEDLLKSEASLNMVKKEEDSPNFLEIPTENILKIKQPAFNELRSSTRLNEDSKSKILIEEIEEDPEEEDETDEETPTNSHSDEEVRTNEWSFTRSVLENENEACVDVNKYSENISPQEEGDITGKLLSGDCSVECTTKISKESSESSPTERGENISSISSEDFDKNSENTQVKESNGVVSAQSQELNDSGNGLSFENSQDDHAADEHGQSQSFQNNAPAPDSSDNNFLSTEEPVPNDTPLPRKLNILLFGAGDPRHIIHSMAKLYKHQQDLSKDDESSIELTFYVVEGCIEIVARNILLLSIALEQPELLPLRPKVHLFMDVFGNSLMRPSSHQYMVGKSKSLRNIITDPSIKEKLAPFLDIEALKYTERDALENAFNFWLPKAGHTFNIEQYWANRNRSLLGTRYDYRDGAFDWDLNMTLKDRGASQICSQEYRSWRDGGIAFTYPEYEQCKPNKTFASALIRNGEKYLHRGYVGDIQSGPFCSFGLKSNDSRMLKSKYGDNDYRATDVTERNLLEYFFELQEQKPYDHDIETSRRYGSVKLLMGKTLQWNECDVDAMQSYNLPWICGKGVTVKLLSLTEILKLQNDIRGQWKNKFDVVFVGHNYFSFLKPGFVEVLKENSLLILETKLWTVGRKDDVMDFEKKLKEFARALNLVPTLNYNALNTKYSTLKFKKVAAKQEKKVVN